MRRKHHNRAGIQLICISPASISPHRAAEQLSLNGAIEQWLSACSVTHKPSTCSTYSRIADRHISREIGDCLVSELTCAKISDYLNGLLHGSSQRPPLSSSTIYSILTVLRGALRYAENQGARFYGWGALHRPRKVFREAIVLTAQEQLQLENRILDAPTPFNIGVLLCLYTGLRIGELCALKWGDISAAGILTVRRTVQRIRNPNRTEQDPRRTIVIFDTPKSEASWRSIPLSSWVREWLETWRHPPDCFLLTGDAARFKEPRSAQFQFKKLLKQAGVRDVNFHCLRHTFATQCIQLGFDAKTLSQILGHADVHTTLNTYVHPPLSTVQTMMERLNRAHPPEAGQPKGVPPGAD